MKEIFLIFNNKRKISLILNLYTIEIGIRDKVQVLKNQINRKDYLNMSRSGFIF